MRDGWQLKRLRDVCEFKGGGTPSKAVEQYWRGDVPWVSPKDMKAQVVLDSIDHITPEAVAASATSMIEPGSILMVVRSGILARTVPIGIAGRSLAINQDLKALCPRASIDSWFLYYLLEAKMSELLALVSRGATVHRLITEQIRDIEFTLPPLAEQRRIVAMLDEAFEGIATAKANAEKNLQNARELFESKLYELLGQDVSGWPRKTLREVAVDFGRGRSKHRPRNDPKLYGGPYPFIQTGDVRGAEHLITEHTQSYSEAGLAQSKLWPRGTLCITIAANIAETGVLDFNACFPDSVIGVVVDERKTSSKYLEYMLHTVKADLKAKGKGSAQDNINLATFENERFPFPDLGAQTRVVRLLDDLSSSVQRLEGLCTLKLTALDALKKSLLHQAFTGTLTAKATDQQVAEVA